MMLKKNLILNKLKKKIKNKKLSIGTWMQISSPDIAEILSSDIYEWIVLDLEHGSFSLDQLSNIFRAIELNEKIPFVRMKDSNCHDIGPILDSGAQGIIIPKVESKNALEAIIKKTKYPPYGERGVGFSRSNLFGKNFKRVIDEKQHPIIIPMIETKKGIENLDEILKIKDVNLIFLGPYDLSASYGIVGNFKSSKFKNILRKIFKLIKKYDKNIGIHQVEPDKQEMKNKINNGFKFIAYSVDTFFLRKN